MNVRAVMRSKIVANEHPMEIGAGDIVRLNIRTNTNMCRQSRIPRLNGEDDGHLHAMVVMPVLTDMVYRYGPPRRAPL